MASIIIGQYLLIENAGKALPVFTTIGLVLVYFTAFALSLIHYKIMPDQLIMHRLFADVKIDRNQIKKAELLHKNKIRWLSGFLVLVDYLDTLDILETKRLEVLPGMQLGETELF